MRLGYLVLASERRIIVVKADDSEDIREAIGSTVLEHGTTFATEDQLLIGGDEVHGMPADWFWVHGVPFPFSGNAVLIGVSQLDGDTLEHPAMTIDEFRSRVAFASRAEVICAISEQVGHE